MLYFDFGHVGYRHAHQDALNVMLWTYGRPILIDPGLSNYDSSLPMVNYGMDTFSHNTVLVDNRPQRRAWYNNPAPARMPYQEVPGFRWNTTARADSAAGLYDGAYGLPGPSDAYPYSAGSNFRQGWGFPARHYRRILYVRPDIFLVADTLIPQDALIHEYDVRWHLDTVNRRIDKNGFNIVTEDADLPNLELVPLFPEGLDVTVTSGQVSPEILGWNAGDPLDPIPSTTVQHRKVGANIVQFLTLLLPLDRGVPSLLRNHERLNASTVAVELTDGRFFVIEAPLDPQHDLAVHLPGDSGGGFDVWRGIHFTYEERQDAAISGEDAAPAGDGVPNLLKYALGLQPLDTARDLLPTAEILKANGERYLSLSFSQAADVKDIAYSVEVAGGLGEPGTPAEKVHKIEKFDGSMEYLFRDNVPVNEHQRRFIWLSLERR